MEYSPEDSQSSDFRARSISSFASGNISSPSSERKTPKILPKPGQIWRGRDLDGISEYEILIDRADGENVWYFFSYDSNSFVTRHSCSLSIFLALYSPQRKDRTSCQPRPLYLPPQLSSSKTSSPEPPPSSTVWAKLWESLHARLRRFF